MQRDFELPGEYHLIAPGCILVDHGPVHMTISAWRGDRPAEDAAELGARTALRLLAQLAEKLDLARQPVYRLQSADGVSDIPQVLARMIAATAELNQEDITPMAAVAGAFADMVKEAVVGAGADRVIVNNGGDIAFCRGRSKRPVRIGIAADLAGGAVTHVVDMPGSRACSHVEGVATSGFGGRSLTKGIASAVTCFAASSALADAAATSVANAATLDHAAIEKCQAEKLDALTDIRGQMVTCRIGQLSRPAVSAALANGLQRSRQLCRQKMIAACIIFIRGSFGLWPPQFARQVRTCQNAEKRGA